MSDNTRRDQNDQSAAPLQSIGAILDVLSPKLFELEAETPARAEATQPLAKPAKARGSKAKRAEAGAAIVARPDRIEKVFLAREFVLCTLPHRDPGAVTMWVRSNGNYTLALQPGGNLQTRQSYGLPFGSIPRLILLWIATEAVRKKSRRIQLSKNLTSFVEEIGLNSQTGRGPRGDATRLKEQMLRLFNCRISFEYTEGDETKGRVTRLNMEVANRVQYWWDFQNPDQQSPFEGEIVLGEDFYNALIASPVPLDMRPLIALKQSPLAIDLYLWLSHRLHSLKSAGKSEVTIPLALLKEQFGAEYNRVDNFKAAFTEALEKVKEVMPNLEYTMEKKALVLRLSQAPLAIGPRDRPRRNPALDQVNRISPKTRAWFETAFPGHSFESAESDFQGWRETQGVEAQNANALFRKFARTWVNNRPL